jgi:hypothetical protein
MRVNGTAEITTDLELRESFAFDGKAHDAAYPERVRQTIY